MLGSKLIGILDRVSRPDSGLSRSSSRKPRLKAIELVANLLSSTLIAVTGCGFVAFTALIFVPPPFWSQLDTAFQTGYWSLFTEKVNRFEFALREKNEAQVQENSHMFFGLAGNLRPRDHGEAHYVRALEAALLSTTQAVRLKASETGIALRPNDSLFWYHLGIERLQAGLTGPGIEALQNAFRLRPYSRQTATALIRALESIRNDEAILRVRAEYVSGVSSVVGKMMPLHVVYSRSDGSIEGELQRFDACGPVSLALRSGSDLKLSAIYFPQVDGLRVSVDAVTMRAIERLQNFMATSSGELVSEIAANEPFMTTPGIIFMGSPQASSIQIEFCVTDRVEP